MLSLKLILLLFGVLGIQGEYTYHQRAGGSLKFHRRPTTWHEARMRCHLEGGILASPLDAGMLQVMGELSHAHGGGYVFLGFHATFSKGDFYSIEGLPIEEAPWMGSWNPNNWKNQEDCVAFDRNSGLMDVSCNEPLPYMCFKKGAPKAVEIGPCGPADNGYTLDERTGSCYKFHETPRTWSRAFMTCSVERAHLVVINSELEAQVLTELVQTYPNGTMQDHAVMDFLYVGVQDWGERGDWQTVQGESLAEAGYARFAHDMPRGTGGCLGMWHNVGLLVNLDCDSIHGFFCEKRPTN